MHLVFGLWKSGNVSKPAKVNKMCIRSDQAVLLNKPHALLWLFNIHHRWKEITRKSSEVPFIAFNTARSKNRLFLFNLFIHNPSNQTKPKDLRQATAFTLELTKILLMNQCFLIVWLSMENTFYWCMQED